MAAPSVAASCFVLALAGVGHSVWLIQMLGVALSCVMAVVGAQLMGLARVRSVPIVAAIGLMLVGLAAPLLSGASGPERWVQFGPMNLYAAPVVLPAFLVVFSYSIGNRDRLMWLALLATVGAGVLLVVQPDASQLLALSVAVMVAIIGARLNAWGAIGTLFLMTLATVLAFLRRDPLEPVPHVEGVFLLAFQHSMLSGAAVVAAAVSLIVGLYVLSDKSFRWLSSVASYYAMLFICSVAGLTPAPLIGYGAGPLLGFGLMAAMSLWAGAKALPDNSVKPVPLRGAA